MTIHEAGEIVATGAQVLPDLLLVALFLPPILTVFAAGWLVSKWRALRAR